MMKTANVEYGAVQMHVNLVDLEKSCRMRVSLVAKMGSDTAENGPSKDWATKPALDPTILPRSSKHL